MKTTFQVIATILLLNTCLSTFAQELSDNNIKYTGTTVEKTYHLYNDKKNPACSLLIHFFYPNSYSDSKLLGEIQKQFIKNSLGEDYTELSPEQAAKKYADNFIEEYKQMYEYSNLFREEEEYAKENGEDIQDYISIYTYESQLRNTILFNKGGIVSEVANSYIYAGGAHGSSYTKGMILDLETGKQVFYEDIFEDDKKYFLSYLIIKELLTLYEVETKEELEDLGFWIDKLLPLDNFIVDDKGVTFIFNQYEIAPYVYGIIEVFLPYKKLLPCMKSSSPIIKIVPKELVEE